VSTVLAPAESDCICTVRAWGHMLRPMRENKPLVLVAFVAVCVIWGSTYFAIRVAVESYPPFAIGAVRFLVAGAVLFALARLRRERMPTRSQWASAFVTGALFFVVGNGLVNVAELRLSSGVVSVLVATMPLWATMFARFFGQHASTREVFGVALGLAGVLVMNLGGDLRGSGVGVALGVLAPMGWALGSMASKRLPLPRGMMLTASQMLAGGVLMLLVSLASGERALVLPGPRTMAAIAYLCVFGSLVGFSAYSYLLQHTRPVVATSYAYVNPVIAVALGLAFGGERFGWGSFAGGAIVLAAVALVRRSAGKPDVEPAAQVGLRFGRATVRG
jgi:drug/metabolite transporter (DMT)-like permease